MSGKDTMGFLTESTLLPRKAREIASVSSASLADLRAAVGAAAAGTERGRHAGGPAAVAPDAARKRGRDGIFDSIAARRAAAARLPLASNAGVAARAAADTAAADDDAARLRASRVSLAQKAAIYEALSGGAGTGGAGAPSALLLDAAALPLSLRRAVGDAIRDADNGDRGALVRVGRIGRASGGRPEPRHITSANEGSSGRIGGPGGRGRDEGFLVDFRTKRRAEPAALAAADAASAPGPLQRGHEDADSGSDDGFGPPAPASRARADSDPRAAAIALLTRAIHGDDDSARYGDGDEAPSGSNAPSDAGVDDASPAVPRRLLPLALLARLRALPPGAMNDPSRLLVSLARDDAVALREHAAAVRAAHTAVGASLWASVTGGGAAGAEAALSRLGGRRGLRSSVATSTALQHPRVPVDAAVVAASRPGGDSAEDDGGGGSTDAAHWAELRRGTVGRPPPMASHVVGDAAVGGDDDGDYRAVPPPRGLQGRLRDR